MLFHSLRSGSSNAVRFAGRRSIHYTPARLDAGNSAKNAANSAKDAAGNAKNAAEGAGKQAVKESGAADTAKDAAGKVKETTESAANQAKSSGVVDKAKEAAGSIKEAAQDVGNKVKQSGAPETAKDAAGSAKDAAGNAKEAAKNAGEQASGNASSGTVKSTAQGAVDQLSNLAERAKALGKPLVERASSATGVNVSTYTDSLTYNLRVAGSVFKQVYVAEGMAPPRSFSTVQEAYRTMYTRAADPNFWTNMANTGEWKRFAIYSLEAYFIFTVGEMIGRRHLVGYKIDKSAYPAHDEHH